MGAADPGAPRQSLEKLRSKNTNDCQLVFPNGNKYVGEVKNGQMDGHGVMHYKNGDVYKGEWLKGNKNGFGTYIYSKDQKKYVGYWEDNLYDGEGALYYPDGSYFNGKFLEGEKHGKGKYVDAEGEDYEEEWKNGEVQVRLLRISSKHDDGSLHSKQKNDHYRDDEDEEHHLNSRREQSSPKSDYDSNEKKRKPEKKKKEQEAEGEGENEGEGEGEEDKRLHSNILFKSQNDFESGEGRNYDVGLETLNIIEHIDMLNSAAGTLLNKNIADWNTDDVSEWLRHLGLDEYIDIFKQNHIDGSHLFEITESDLKDEFKMMSVGHRKNFMKAIGNLKKIFCGSSGKNSEYIRQKIHKFYEKNKQKNNKMGLIGGLGGVGGVGSDPKFYSHKFYTKTLYSEQIIEEDDEQSNKYETNPSPTITAKNDEEHIDSLVLSERKKTNNNIQSCSEDRQKSQMEFEIDDDIMQVRSRGMSKEEAGILGEHTHPKLIVETKPGQKNLLLKPSSDSKTASPLKKDNNSSEKQPSNEDGNKTDRNPQQQQTKNEKHAFNSPDPSSSSSSSDTDTSDDDNKTKKPEEKTKDDQAVGDTGVPKIVVKGEQKVVDKKLKKASSAFKSAEFSTNKSKQNPYKDGQKVKKRHRHYKKGDLEDINQKIKDDIVRKFRESGLNENFIINYNELFFEKKIGEGGYGRVYLGKFSGIEVAIKEYGKRKLDTRRAEDFVKEVEVISNLRHPNIVLYMGACIHNGKYLMITEYLEEGSLFDHLHKKHTKIGDDVLFNIIEDIALGMCYLHGRKVLHCDLKSSNILIDSSWSVKLCDFGLSRVKYKSDRKRFAKQRVGTPHWMAPEILRGEKYDEAADVYSFGMIIWEMVVGEIPYCNVAINDIITTVGHEGKQVPFPAKGNALILSIMRSCLGLEKHARPTFKEIVGQLQQRNKGNAPAKKNELFNFFGN